MNIDQYLKNIFNLKKYNINLLVIYGLLNAIVFFVLAIIAKEINLISINIIAFIIFIFTVTSLVIFFIALCNGYILVPIFWYIFGSSIFFGVGAIGHVYHLFDQSSFVWYGGYSTKDVIDVCIINGLASILILATSYLFIPNKEKYSLEKNDEITLIFITKILIFFSLILLIIKLSLYANINNLILRGILDKLNFLILTSFFLNGLFFYKISFKFKCFVLLNLITYVLFGLFQASKYESIIFYLAFAVGYITNQRIEKYFYVKKSLIIFIIFIILFFSHVFINIARGNCLYSVNNSISQRFSVFEDSINIIIFNNTRCININNDVFDLRTKNKINSDDIRFNTENYINEINNFNITSGNNQFFKLLRRLSTTSVASFLINMHDGGFSGNSLNNIYIYFVPRIIWPDKPIVTNLSLELGQLYYPGTAPNALGPSFSADLYWNYGYRGVLTGSLLIGLVISFLNWLSILFLTGKNNTYVLIAVPAIIYSFWLENWVGPTFIGGFISMLQILIVFYFVKFSYRHLYLKNKLTFF